MGCTVLLDKRLCAGLGDALAHVSAPRAYGSVNTHMTPVPCGRSVPVSGA